MEKPPINPDHHTIIILGMTADGRLILSDNGTTDAHPGDIITWQIADTSGIASIYIIDGLHSTDVFKPDPAKIRYSTDWQGTIRHNLPEGAEEAYTIFFFLHRGDEIGREDPKIKVNPKVPPIL